MTAITEEVAKAIRSTAIAYCAITEAGINSDHNGVIVWGRMLIKAQAVTGVEVLDFDTINERIHRAEAALKGVVA